MSWLKSTLRNEKLIAGVSVVVTLALAGVLTVVPADALTTDRSVSSSDGNVAITDQVSSADSNNDVHGTVRLSDQQDAANQAAMPDNPNAQLPTQVSESIPDDATVVSENLAVTTDGEVKNIETGQTVTDETIVGTQAAPADPLAKTDGKSFIPVDASDVKAAVTVNGGDANAVTQDGETQDSATQPDANTVALQRSTSAHVYKASLGNGSYGAHWGTYNGTQAFFEQDGTLFAQQARGVIDVSAWQGVIDWAKAKAAGVEGAIIRIGYGSGNAIDKQAQRNINECKRLGIPFGVYLYSYAERASDGTEEGKDVVAKLRQLGVKPSDLTYPVYYDTENWTGTWTGHKAPTDPNVWNGAINNWWSQLRGASYTNLSVYSYPNYLNTALNTANIHAKTRWVASYDSRTNFSFSTNDRGWQYTSQGNVAGINGTVDLNAFGYRDYQAAIDVRTLPSVSVPDGAYYINAMLKDSSGVDIPRSSTSNGTRIQLYQHNKGVNQQFRFTMQSDGSYVITSICSGKVLDVAGGNAGIGAVVQQYDANGTVAQRWFIRDSGRGYYLQSALGNWVLDIANASTTNGTSIRLYAPNGSLAQQFVFASTNLPITSGQTMTVASALNRSLVMDITAASPSDGARAQLYSSNHTDAQIYRFDEIGNGVFRITNASSGKVLEVAGAYAGNGGTVQQYRSNGTNAQHWSLMNYGNGRYAFINNASAKAIDVPNAGAASGVRLQSYARNGTNAQLWSLFVAKTLRQRLNESAAANKSVLKDGIYAISSRGKSSMVVDVSGGLHASGANVQLYGSNRTNAQRWSISHDASGYVTVTNVGSGKVLDVSGASTANGANIQQYQSNNTYAQKWIAVRNADGSITLHSALAEGMVLDVSAGRMSNGANIQLYASNGTNAQKWMFRKE